MCRLVLKEAHAADLPPAPARSLSQEDGVGIIEARSHTFR